MVTYEFTPRRMPTHTYLNLSVIPVVGPGIVKVLLAVGLLSVTLPLGLILDTRPVFPPTSPLESALLIGHGHDTVVEWHIRPIGCLHHAEQEPSWADGVLNTGPAIPQEPAFTDRMPRHLQIRMEIVQALTELGWGTTHPEAVRVPEVEPLFRWRGRVLANRDRCLIASRHPYPKTFMANSCTRSLLLDLQCRAMRARAIL